MFKPLDDDYASPSEEISNFTNRENEQEVLRRVLNLPEGATLPVLMFYGVGGTGKTWLLQKLRQCLDKEIPSAYLDLDPRSGASGYFSDSSRALAEIRRQFRTVTCPRFDLAYAWIRYKESAGDEPLFGTAGLLHGAWELLSQVAGSVIPGGNLATWFAGKLSKPFWERFHTTKLGEWICTRVGEKEFLRLRQEDTQRIYPELPHRLLIDLKEYLPAQNGKKCRGVVFVDTFEALRLGLLADAQAHEQEARIRELYNPDSPVLLVIAGRDYLRWAEVEPDFDKRTHLEQHLLGGLSEWDAREFLKKCGILHAPLQDAVLRVSRDVETQQCDDALGYHPFSLGICADTILATEDRGLTIDPAQFDMAPGNTRQLAQRFMKSLGDEAHAAWVRRLSLTPRFDEVAARAAFSPHAGAAQDAAWEALLRYSFVKLADIRGWYTFHSKMREALEYVQQGGESPASDCSKGNNDETSSFTKGHQYWREHWLARSKADTDNFAALAWYHLWRIEPKSATRVWKAIAAQLRKELRMLEHHALLSWWQPTRLDEETPPGDALAAAALNTLGIEYFEAALGNRRENLDRAIECHLAALRFYTESGLPQSWAHTQINLGNAYLELPVGHRSENLNRAIQCYQAALSVYTEDDFPYDWAASQNNLGNAYLMLTAGNRAENLQRAIECYQAALRVYTQDNFPQKWAGTQDNMGNAYLDLPMGNQCDNLQQAIECYQAALSVYSENSFPQYWAHAQSHLSGAYVRLPTGNRSENVQRAIDCSKAALRVFTGDDFPYDWAATQIDLGVAYRHLPAGNRGEKLQRASECYQAALRVFTERDFPQHWALAKSNMALVYCDLAKDTSDASFLVLAQNAYADAERGYRACGLDVEADRARQHSKAINT